MTVLRTGPPAQSRPDRAPRPYAGVAAGTALVLLAVVAGVLAEQAAGGSGRAAAPAALAGTEVTPTGHTTTVAVTARGMRYVPDRVAVPAGDRLVIVFTNADARGHDLVLATGARTGTLGPGGRERLDAGVIGGEVAGWCSRPGHRQAGMVLTIVATGAPAAAARPDRAGTGSAHGHAGPAAGPGRPAVDAMADPGPGFTARDATLQPAPRERVHRVTLHAREVRGEVAPGVSQILWTFGGAAPGPVLRGRVGDVFEVTLINDASVEHGIDFHAAALAPDTGMRTVEPGGGTTYRFAATRSGAWLYHCSAMPVSHHVGAGMYGALIIDPPDLEPVDREYVLVQSEFHLDPAGGPGDPAGIRAGQADLVVFNGYASQYAFRPLAARAGERVRFWVVDAGPNRSSAFHVVGAPFDTLYAEGGYRLRRADPGGAQILDLAPAAGGFVETVFTQAGDYPFLTHALADADLGARGLVRVTPAAAAGTPDTP